MHNKSIDPDTSRYSRQTILPSIGRDGQGRLQKARIAVAGCGALGSAALQIFARMGIGYIRIIDRDVVELSNLHRQILYDEEDAEKVRPKATAAAEHLSRINSGIELDPRVADITSNTVEDLLGDVDCIIDGSDNFELRFLINDFSLSAVIPWVYAGVVATYGMTYTFLPGETPCFRCYLPNQPPPGSYETCDSAGVLPPAVQAVAAMETTEALKLLTDRREALLNSMQCIDIYSGSRNNFSIEKPAGGCPACDYGRYEYLNSAKGSHTVRLCGRNAYQLTLPAPGKEGIKRLSLQLHAIGEVVVNEYLLRLSIPPREITLFYNGRTLVKGARSEDEARSLAARYIGL